MPYEIVFAESVKGHLQVLTTRDQAAVLNAIERQLLNQPAVEARNRKPLRPNPVCAMGIACGPASGVLRCERRAATGRAGVGGVRAGTQGAPNRQPGDPAVKTITLPNAPRPLAEHAADLGDERVVFTQRNRPARQCTLAARSESSLVAIEFLELIARSQESTRSIHRLAEMRRLLSIEAVSLAADKSASAAYKSEPRKRSRLSAGVRRRLWSVECDVTGVLRLRDNTRRLASAAVVDGHTVRAAVHRDHPHVRISGAGGTHSRRHRTAAERNGCPPPSSRPGSPNRRATLPCCWRC